MGDLLGVRCSTKAVRKVRLRDYVSIRLVLLLEKKDSEKGLMMAKLIDVVMIAAVTETMRAKMMDVRLVLSMGLLMVLWTAYG